MNNSKLLSSLRLEHPDSLGLSKAEALEARERLLANPDLGVFLHWLADLRRLDLLPQVPPQHLSLNDHLMQVEGRKQLFDKIAFFLDPTSHISLR